jgi:Asp-tRNA(Asn)/Glu-tRNA(Gln) amidotransferase A subunit family amidase
MKILYAGGRSCVHQPTPIATMKLFATLAAFVLPTACTFTGQLFDSREATIDGVHDAIFSGMASCRDVVSSFIARIEAFNPTVNAIISLNTNALKIADEIDLRIASGNSTGSLLCIPVLLKDNFDTFDMNTTGGSLALAGNKPLADAPVVAVLKNSGAIILGKTNLQELALEGISVSSLGGQTINPYDHSRTPGGSSGGSGAAISCSFAVFSTGMRTVSLHERAWLGLADSVGTDTVNSLRNPASANSLYSFRPTRGLISRSSIMPNSYTQDTAGAIARTVHDLAVALTVMASVGYDENDNATALIPPSSVGLDYTEELRGGSLEGLRFGLVKGFCNRTVSEETTPVNEVMDGMVSMLEAAGATVMSIDDAVYNATEIALLDVQAYEFREAMDAYLHRPTNGGHHPSTLEELYGGGKFLVLPAQYNHIKAALRSSTNNASYVDRILEIRNLVAVATATITDNKLDAIIYPEQKNLVVKLGSPSQAGRNGILAALTGFPVVTIPAGFSSPTVEAPVGVPIGMEILGLPWSEDRLLNMAYHISNIHDVRRMPSFANGSVEARAYDSVPSIIPDITNIPAPYPVGIL